MVLRVKGKELGLPIALPGEMKILIEWKLLLLRKLYCPWSSLLPLQIPIVVQKLFLFLIKKSSDYMAIIFHD